MLGLESRAESTLATRALRAVHGDAARASSSESPAGLIPDREPTSVRSTVCKADIVRDDLTDLYLGQYALGPKIGGGGMGKVFRARHVHLDRLFAIKFMAADLSGHSEAEDRFEAETLALGHLQHPQIVNAVDAGCHDGLRFLVMEFIEGEDLAQLVNRRGAIPPEEACDLIRQVALGLAYSHSCGFVHRDIKPSNLILNRAGIVKILDFGLVRSERRDHQLTDQGEPLGTWDFLAPEQAQDATKVDHRSDIYSLGCTFLYLLSGDVPFSNSQYATPAAKLKGQLFDTPEWLQKRSSKLPAELRNVLIRMLAKSPSKRFQTASDVVAALTPSTTVRREIKANPKAAQNTPGESSVRRTLGKLAGGFFLAGLFTCLASYQMHAGAGVGTLEPHIPASVPSKPGELGASEEFAHRIAPQNVPEKAEKKDLIEASEVSPSPSRNSQRSAVDLGPDDNAVPIIVPFPKTPRRIWRF